MRKQFETLGENENSKNLKTNAPSIWSRYVEAPARTLWFKNQRYSLGIQFGYLNLKRIWGLPEYQNIKFKYPNEGEESDKALFKVYLFGTSTLLTRKVDQYNKLKKDEFLRDQGIRQEIIERDVRKGFFEFPYGLARNTPSIPASLIRTLGGPRTPTGSGGGGGGGGGGE